MSKFEMMVNSVLNRYMFVVDGQQVSRAEASDTGRSVWFWLADGRGVQIDREAFSAIEVHAPDNKEARDHTHIIRDCRGKPHTIVAAEIKSYDFTSAMRETLWDWD